MAFSTVVAFNRFPERASIHTVAFHRLALVGCGNNLGGFSQYDPTWKGKEISCPAIFEMQPTDRGMCCSFNMEKAENIFQKSKYSELISQAQKEAFENRQVQDYNKIPTI